MYRAIDSIGVLLGESDDSRICVLKHSVRCPISGWAKREVDSLMEEHPDIDVYLLIVQEQRGISLELAEILGVPHQSPQFLVIKDRNAGHVLNHYKIKVKAILRALG